jgi:hypothetical protein
MNGEEIRNAYEHLFREHKGLRPRERPGEF